MKQSKIYREPTVKGRTRTQINDLEQKEEINIQPEQKKQEFKKMRRG